MEWPVRIIALRTIRNFWEIPANADSIRPLINWYAVAKRASWSSPQDVKNFYGNVSIIGNSRIVFNIAGNRYRLIVKFNFSQKIGYIRFIGTHAQYNNIDAETV
jgi:mRNA interferase HigB